MNGTEDFVALFGSLGRTGLAQIALILAGAWFLIYLSQRFIPWLANRLSGRLRLQILASVPVLRLVIIAAALGLIIPRVVEPTFQNLVTLLGALGLAIGFALKDYASSLMAGIVALYEMPYRPGDWIEIGGIYGEVRSMGMRAVEVVTPDDTLVVIPHLKLWDHPIHNANDGSQNLMCVADFYLHPHHDAGLVKHTLHDVALASPYLQLRLPVSVIVHERPWATHYRLKAYPVDPRQQFQFTTDLTVRGKAALSGLGVAFAATPALPVAA